MILSIDPGREKCGVAVLTQRGTIKYQQVWAVEKLETKIKQLQTVYQLEELILGNGTNSNTFKQQLASFSAQITVVEEAYSTLQAREYYWQENPPAGWRRLIPTSLQTPPEPVDDYVAVILGLRHLGIKV